MRYRYTGVVPALIVIKGDLTEVSPGEEVEVPSAPMGYFVSVSEEKAQPSPSKKSRSEKTQEINNAIST